MTLEKRRLCYFLLALAWLSITPAISNAENRSLADRFPQGDAASILLDASQWHPFPRAAERDAWEAIPADVREKILALGADYASRPVPSLPATLYLEFRREGNRDRFQRGWFERRALLGGLALAECVEGKGRFLDPLTNVIWAICEESSWALPAHIGAQKAGVGLPDTTEPIVALFSAETASTLAWVLYLLEDELDGVSPLISSRVRREIDSRIITPYQERDDFGWMGFRSKSRPNNWNPWVNSNVLAATLLLEQDQERRLEIVHKVLRSLDRFFVPYPSDGSCDEGPSYWGRAGASLFEDLELLYSVTQGKFDVYDDPVVREIGRFITRLHVADDVFVCVGDCDVAASPPRDLVFRYGQRIQDKAMMDLARSGVAGEELWSQHYGPWSLMRPLYALFNLSNLRADKASPPLLRDVWLNDPDMQLMVARDQEGSADGLFVAAWGAHNGQSHNHNDVGNFIVYQNGKPVLIDVGRPTYTRQTFSRDRYKIWAMQSAYHNLPTVNGQMQGAGGRYKATDVDYQADENSAELKMNQASAYPKSAGIASWIRTVRLARGDSVEVVDNFVLQDESSDIVEHLLTSCEVKPLGDGRLSLTNAEAGTNVLLSISPPELKVDVETIPLDDERLTAMWGSAIRRISIHADKPQKQATWRIQVSPAK